MVVEVAVPVWVWEFQLPQVGLEAQVRGVAVQARYRTS